MTLSHNYFTVQVRLDNPPQPLWLGAEVLYTTGPSATYDLAFLKLSKSSSEDMPVLRSLPPVSMKDYRKGEIRSMRYIFVLLSHLGECAVKSVCIPKDGCII